MKKFCALLLTAALTLGLSLESYADTGAKPEAATPSGQFTGGLRPIKFFSALSKRKKQNKKRRVAAMKRARWAVKW